MLVDVPSSVSCSAADKRRPSPQQSVKVTPIAAALARSQREEPPPLADGVFVENGFDPIIKGCGPSFGSISGYTGPIRTVIGI